MVSAIISRLVILVFGTLYPAYASYKAVRTKNVKEYVKWMMYWIVFALFTSVETFSDVLLSWMPFYYEIKIVFVIWLLSPMTKGSSFLFRKFVHPNLARREKEIDEMIAQARNQSYTALLKLGSRGLTYASQVVVRTALIGQTKLVDHMRRSYSTSDLTNDGAQIVTRHKPVGDEDEEDELDNRLLEDNAELEQRSRQMKHFTRSSSSSSSTLGLHPLKEMEEEDEEEISFTETYTIPVSTRNFYSPKEGEDSNLSVPSSESIDSAGTTSASNITPSLFSSRQRRSGSWSGNSSSLNKSTQLHKHGQESLSNTKTDQHLWHNTTLSKSQPQLQENCSLIQ